MGILSRFKEIMSANLNAALKKAENANADKLLEKYLRDAKENLAQVKAETAAVIAEEMGLARKITECEAICNKQEKYAIAAIKSGNEEDAKKFLTYKSHLEQQVEDLTAQYDIAKSNSEKMRQMTKKLVEDIQATESKMRELKQKLAVAKQREKLNQIDEALGNSSFGDFDNLFDVVQKRIDAADAAAGLNVELVNEGQEIEDLAKKYDADANQLKKDTVEEQLARLKAGLQ